VPSAASSSTIRDEDPSQAPLPGGDPRLRVLASPDAKLVGRELELFQAVPFLLGREVDRYGISVADPRMSRLHARVVWDGRNSMSRLGDAGSANGCYVDGQRQKSAVLRHGSVIRLGDTVLAFCEKDSMTLVLERAEQAAQADVSVLIIGPTGTGKELLARRIHAASKRPGDFIAVNCASLSENLVGSELFGHLRGAFSGAGVERPGLFRAAHRGTLLLDEVGDLPMALQPALLRALQERAIRPLGAEREVPVDVRIVAATHQDLRRAMAENRFRQDLFARLAQIELDMPPLKERAHEIAALIGVISSRLGLTVNVSADAMESLALWHWPHNVRELENLLLKLSVFSGKASVLDRAFLEREAPQMLERLQRPARGAKPEAAPPSSKRPNRDELSRAMARHANNVVAVAEEFATSRTQVYRWLKRFGLATPRSKT